MDWNECIYKVLENNKTALNSLVPLITVTQLAAYLGITCTI